MTAPIPAAELIAERCYGGRHTARILCPYCGRTHLHPWRADTSPHMAGCGQGLYTLGTERKP